MEVDAGLWAILAGIVGFISLGCLMTSSRHGLESLGYTVRKPSGDRH